MLAIFLGCGISLSSSSSRRIDRVVPPPVRCLVLDQRGEEVTPPRWWPGDQNISPLFIPRSPEVAGCGGVPGSLTENYKHCVKHKPSAAARSRSQRRGLYRTLTLCYISLSSQIITQLTFLWPGRQRGHLPTCFCTCLLLDALVWCLPSSELSVLSLEAGETLVMVSGLGQPTPV